MTNDYLAKKVFHKYLFISIMATLAATVGMLADGVVIGQCLGADCVSAQGLASPVFILITAAAGVFCNGGTSCCSNHSALRQRWRHLYLHARLWKCL